MASSSSSSSSSHWEIKNASQMTAGDTLMKGRYCVIGDIGRGGQGAAFLVRDNENNAE
jgi:hypothetical protein